MSRQYDFIGRVRLNGEYHQVVNAKAFKSSDAPTAYLAVYDRNDKPITSAFYNFPVWISDWKQWDNLTGMNSGRVVEVALHPSELESSDLIIAAVKIDGTWVTPEAHAIEPFLTVPFQ